MDAERVQQLLREDAARLDDELARIDRAEFAGRVLKRIGITQDPQDPPAGESERR
jgi:hypothetical protein